MGGRGMNIKKYCSCPFNKFTRSINDEGFCTFCGAEVEGG